MTMPLNFKPSPRIELIEGREDGTGPLLWFGIRCEGPEEMLVIDGRSYDQALEDARSWDLPILILTKPT